jgi:hypothetical protein
MDPVTPVTKTVFLAGADIGFHPRTKQVQARSAADRVAAKDGQTRAAHSGDAEPFYRLTRRRKPEQYCNHNGASVALDDRTL